MPLEPIKTRLENIAELTPTIRHFRLRFPEGKWVPFKAGQFCSIHIPEVCGLDQKSGKPLRRAYSIASSPREEGYLDLCIKRVEGGPGTNWLWQQKEGAEILITLPYGKFVMKEPVDYSQIFVATGTGIAPFRSMVRVLSSDGMIPKLKEVCLIFGVRYEDEILYDEEWKEIAGRHRNFRFLPTISRPKKWEGEVGYVQEKLKKFVKDPAGKQIYICGLGNMVKAVEQAAAEIGFTKDQINFERYD